MRVKGAFGEFTGPPLNQPCTSKEGCKVNGAALIPAADTTVPLCK